MFIPMPLIFNLYLHFWSDKRCLCCWHIYPFSRQHRPAPYPGHCRLQDAEARCPGHREPAGAWRRSAAAGRQLLERCGWSGDAGAQSDHRPPQPPGLCAESVHEGQCLVLNFRMFSRLWVHPSLMGTWHSCGKASAVGHCAVNHVPYYLPHGLKESFTFL